MEVVTAGPPVMTAGRARGARTSASTVAFAMFVAVTLAGLGGLGGRLFAVFFVAAAAVAGLVAYYRAPTRYVVFVFALWFFTPFVRRVVDLHHGFQPASFVLMAPVLVTLIAGLTMVYRARELRGALMYPFVFMLTGVLYGYFIGVLKNGVVPATYALLTWVGPISFSIHLILSWRTLPALRTAFLNFLQWAIPVLGAYGIYQVVALPSWDQYWMVAANVASIGAPIPFGFRAFGTMNSPGPYAVALMVGMLFLFGTARRGMVFALTLALIALLLTRTRSSWVALAMGLFIIQFMGPLRRATRNWFFILLMSAAAVPVLSLDVFRDSITSRLMSFTALEDDNSVRQRVMMSNLAIQEIGRRAEGEGLGSTGGAVKVSADVERGASIDNGFLEIFYVLGWPGGCMVFMGLLGQLLTLSRFRDSRQDAFANAARAAFWAFLSVLLIGDIFSGGTGAMFWGAYGFACSAHAYNYALGKGLRSQQVARDFGAQSPTVTGG